MTSTPTLTKAVYRSRFILDLSFEDGTRKDIDFTIWLHKKGYEALKNKQYFQKCSIKDNHLTWSNGQAIEAAALYEIAKPKSRPKLLELTKQKGR